MEARRVPEQEIGQCDKGHIGKGQMKPGIDAGGRHIRSVFSQILPHKNRYGDAGSDHGHEGKGTDIKGDIGGGQADGTQMPDQQDKDRETGHIQKELHPRGKPEAEQAKKSSFSNRHPLRV
jgi:hypothetical protein